MSREDAEAVIMAARGKAGWIEAEVPAEEEGEDLQVEEDVA